MKSETAGAQEFETYSRVYKWEEEPTAHPVRLVGVVK
jgi:hypothetical protein